MMTTQNQPPTEPTIHRMSEAGDQKPMKTSGFGIASFTLGIIALSTCGLTSLPGLIFGIISIAQIKANRLLLTGRFYAITGIILNVVMLSFFTFICVSQVSIQNGHRTIACSSNLKQLGTAMMMYMNDNDECLPSSDRWVNSISTYVKHNQTFRCPSAWKPKARTGYAMNIHLNGVKVPYDSDLSGIVLLFDAIPGDCPHGGQELIPSPERHILYLKEDGVDIFEMEKNGNSGKRYLKVNIFCFADGHVKPVTIDEVPSLIWKPLKN